MAPDSWFVASSCLAGQNPQILDAFAVLVKQRFTDPLVARALLAISSATWEPTRTQAAWEEEIEYQGRRLAKLGVSPDAVMATFSEAIRMHPETMEPTVRSACDVVLLSIRLHLTRALQQVRDAEAALLSGMFQRELEATTPEGILRGALEAVSGYTRAVVCRAWLRQADAQNRWVRAAVVTAETAGVSSAEERPGLRSVPAWLANAKGEPEAECRVASRITHWRFPLMAHGQILGWYELEFRKSYRWLPRELEVLTATATLCALAVERAQLSRRLESREAQVLRLLEQLVAVEEAERKRIARDLHDEAGQSLMCLRLQLELLERQLVQSKGDNQCRTTLTEAREFTDRSIRDIRRVIAALSPSVLEQLGLCAAIRHLVTRFCELHRIQVESHLPDHLHLSRSIEVAVFRLVQEALNNIGKYAQASKVMIWLESADGGLRIVVQDNGVGFNVASKANQPGCYGLSGIRDRVSFLSGKVTIRSRQGKRSGTTVEIELPVTTEDREVAAKGGRETTEVETDGDKQEHEDTHIAR